MERLTGRFKFKTHEQLIASGWVLKDNVYSLDPLSPVVFSDAMGHLLGAWIDVHSDNHIDEDGAGWSVRESMVLTESQLVQEIINRYD